MNFKKIICLLLAVVMVLGLAACGGKSETPAPTNSGNNSSAETTAAAGGYADPYAEFAEDYDALSAALYEDNLGEFSALYAEAKEAESVSERFALMAIAEAKLLESAVLLPSTSKGGNYAISRIVPNTVTSVMWGNDIDRLHNTIVATEPITAADRAELRAMWAELKGTGTWEDSAKEYLTSHGYTIKESLVQAYRGDPTIWDVLATSRSNDAMAIVNTYDSLVEYNSENVMMPALAESWEVSEDGLTYTFKLREGVMWVDSQGRELAELTADDFVAGFQHMLDAMGGLEYLVNGVIVNAGEYIMGDITDMAEVGVKALDTYTVQYTLTDNIPYFMTMLGYGVFAPMNRMFYESKGGKFGSEYDSSASSYTYGKTPDDIAYCGPFRVTNFTPENTVVFEENKSYWNNENVNIKTLTWMYDSGKDPTSLYNNTINGTIDGAGLNSSSIEAAKKDNLFDTLVYSTPTDASTFPVFFNINRQAYANVADGAAATDKTEEECVRAVAAMRNVHFRRAVAMSIDRGSYNAQTVGESLKLNSLANSYVPGTFVTLAEDTVVSINGTDTTFPAGTYYGEIVQAQIDADGVAIKVWDPEADEGNGSSGGFDGWYNPEAAAAELAIAVEELAAQGVEISAENPIILDLPTWTGNEAFNNRSNALKQSVEAATNGLVKVYLPACNSADDWSNAGYLTNSGFDANYDIYDNSGWSPDYGDPQTYLDTMLDEYAGYMTKCIGIY